jgi:hypothetical protein
VSVNTAGSQGTGASFDSEISGDGLFVVFISIATTLVAGDTNNEADVFVRDLVGGITERVSISTAGSQGDSPSQTGVADPVLSIDGRFAAFSSSMNTLVTDDFNNAADIFVRDRLLGTTVRASVSTAGLENGASSTSPSISADGSLVAFDSGFNATLVPGDGTCDGVFVRDLIAGVTSCLPLRPATGQPATNAEDPAISADGRYVAFISSAAYTPGDASFGDDAFVHDRTTGVTRRASVSFSGHPPNTTSGIPTPGLSADGRVVAFESLASNLVLGDTNNSVDVFVAEWPVLPDPPYIDVVRNGSFTNALENWMTFATPDASYLVTQFTGGVLEFYRQPPPPGEINEAAVLQSTGARYLAHQSIELRVDVGNSSTVRKRITVLLHESDFSDLAVCTFWLPPNAPLRRYVVRAHTTTAWTNATISFYAATPGSDGGFYRIDNVSLQAIPDHDDDRTDCVDPLGPIAPGGAAGPNLIANGGFDSGVPPWLTFGQIVSQVAAGIFEFYRPAGTPAGVVFQPTGTAVAANDILTANFYLGNSSSVRKRVTVLLHDVGFADLSACTFWLPPGLPLAPYRMRTYATQAWGEATISIYPATVGDEQWIQLDNVTLQTTPAASTDGTNCLEPGADIMTALRRGSRPLARVAGDTATPTRVPPAPIRRSEPGDVAVIAHGAERLVVWQDSADLTQSTGARLTFESQLRAGPARAVVQVSVDGVTWETVSTIPGSESWLNLAIDLDRFAGAVVRVRIVFNTLSHDDELRVRHIRVLR